MFNGFAAILIGVYLGAVAYQGNAANFFAAVKQDFTGGGAIPGFFKWFIALVILYVVSKNEKAAPIAKPLFYASVLVLGFNVIRNKTLVQNITNAWNSF